MKYWIHELADTLELVSPIGEPMGPPVRIIVYQALVSSAGLAKFVKNQHLIAHTHIAELAGNR